LLTFKVQLKHIRVGARTMFGECESTSMPSAPVAPSRIVTPGPEPIAIIGIGCRFPGAAAGPESFWRLISEGLDATSEVPADRWSRRVFYDGAGVAPGRSITCRGGFISDIDLFDAEFFGISPREAIRMDPQQRWLLETAWEAIEDAGLVLDQLALSSTGVVIGVSLRDYADLQRDNQDLDAVDSHTSTGLAACMTANRISYHLNLRGPSFAVDTACSSSLLAIHLACQQIWSGQCSAALAGGVNALLHQEPFIGFSHLSVLAPDGRCKAFDASADGFGRAEGAGIIVLKPLSHAQRDGDRIYALIRGSASNQDGQTSSLTTPSIESQTQLIEDACRNAGVDPASVQYVEAHGTGTPVGDPIEAHAIGAAVGQLRPPGSPCRLGSVKTNIGHLESGAGVASVIKVALALRNGVIPPSLHFVTPNPYIPFEKLNLKVQQSPEPWDESEGPPLAGVNSFGFGGANAHLIMQQAPPSHSSPWDERGGQVRYENETDAAETAPSLNLEGDELHEGASDEETSPCLLPLSARSGEALRHLAKKYSDYLGDHPQGIAASLSDLCATAGARRTHHGHRIAVVSHSKEVLRVSLSAFALGETPPNIVAGRVASAAKAPQVVLVCSGQGPQWWAMGRELLQTEPVFRSVMEECDRRLAEIGADWRLMDEFTVEEAASRMHVTAISQPALFCLQVALARLWQSWGIRPAAVVGHSVGEVAAAHLAGVLDLREALRVIYHRGRCMELAPAEGKMLAVEVGPADVPELLDGHHNLISLAAVNTATSVTLSGDGDALDRVAQRCEERQVYCKFLRVQYAFHSAKMEPIRQELLGSLHDLRPAAAAIPFYSTVTGDRLDGAELVAEYWWRNVRQPVQFAPAIERLLETGPAVFVELSPHPVLSGYVSEAAQRRSVAATVIPSLRRGEPERRTMLKGLGMCHCAGVAVDWLGTLPEAGRFVPLPTYAWQRRRFWRESHDSWDFRTGKDFHPSLGHRIAGPAPTWMPRLDCRVVRYLADHQVQGQILAPATLGLEMALSAGEIALGKECVVEDVEFVKACFLETERTTAAQFAFDPHASRWKLCSAPTTPGGEWTEHAHGKLRAAADAPGPAARVDLASIRNRCPLEVAGADCYARLRQSGLEYGPAFQGIERLWRRDGEALGRIVAPAAIEADLDDYHLHPALLDSCLQVLIGALPGQSSGAFSGRLFLPVEVERLRVSGRAGPGVWSHVRLRDWTSKALTADITVISEEGDVVAEVRGFRCVAIEDGPGGGELDDLVYRYQWRLSPKAETANDGRTAASKASRQVSLLRVGEDLPRPDESHSAFAEAVRPLCRSYFLAVLQELGFSVEKGSLIPYDRVTEQLGLTPLSDLLLRRCFRMLEQEGVLEAVEHGGRLRRTALVEEGDSLWRGVVRQYPAFVAELTLLRRCCASLAGILRGEAPSLLAPEGPLPLVEHFLQDSPTFRELNRVTAEAVAALCQQAPPERPLRVLEIGGGIGALTAYVAPRLPTGRARYVFTDPLPHLLARAESKFRDRKDIAYARLDIECDASEQSLEAHSFDIILSAGRLHATADPRAALANVCRFLAPEGVLLLRAPLEAPLWLELVLALINGNFNPPLPLADWRTLLEDAGFSEVVGIEDGDGTAPEHAVILARGPRPAEIAASEVVSALAPELPAAESPADAAPVTSACWMVLCDRGGFGERIAAELEARGQTCRCVAPAGALHNGNGDLHSRATPGREELVQLLRETAHAAGGALRGVIYCGALETPTACGAHAAAFEAGLKSGPLEALQLAQALCDFTQTAAAPRLWLVTRGAQSVIESSELSSPLQAGLWGLGRVIVNEAPQLRVAMIDLSAEGDDHELPSLCDEILADGPEDEVALRGRARYVHRYARTGAEIALCDREQAADEAFAFRLESDRLGTLDSLRLRAFSRQAPGPGQVEIAVHAAGLNFVDVMRSLNLVPTPHDGPPPLGAECSGVVTAVGEGVTEFRPGDEVLAVAPYSFASHVLTDARLAAPKPTNISHEEAATLPIAFLTSLYGLEHLAQMAPGERVLIHVATGGVGLSAIQVVEAHGGEVFATAGSPEKRDFLRGLGIRHVMDSRSLAFADEVMNITGGEGVDIVLNSLAGLAIDKGLSVLADFGRFLEIGKRDIYGDRPLGMKPLRKNISFLAEDLERLIFVPSREKRLGVVARLLRRVSREVEEGRLTPLPHRVFHLANIVSAFRHMSQARHIGKVVISFRDRAAPIAKAPLAGPLFHGDAAYLVTGGLGGFGLTLAGWLAEHGARRLILAGRSAPGEEAAKAIDALRLAGVEVRVAQTDVANRAQLAAVLEEVRRTMGPLKGVFHAAAVLEDCVLTNLDAQRMRRVWTPKAAGAWNLHELTRDDPLEHFVLFSSLASVFGNGGQGNYASANAVLDGLAAYRRGRGLPALCVNWGYLGEVGWLARHGEIGQRLALQGVLPFTPQQALRLLERFLREDAMNVGVLRMDWRRWSKLVGADRVPPRFSEVLEVGGDDEVGELSGAAVRAMLQSGSRAQRIELLRTLLVARAAKVLGATAADIDLERPLNNLGLDSLMAVELRNWIQTELRINLNTVELMRGPSITQLVEALVDQFERDARQGSEEPVPSAAGETAFPAPSLPGDDREAAAREGDDLKLLEEVLEEMPQEQLEALLGQAGRADENP
jgi:acyl transferase domain-containing protein/NADPH:quinone reductase-like Zn-dependent oxidoreductase/acyl carrier protein